ncbi:MAG TPA: YCF48-related protein, partial [Solirubrobacteraceae bacterium]
MRFHPFAVVACALCLVPAGRASAQGFSGVFARDAVDAIAVGDDGEVYRTLDGGGTWTERVLGPPVVALRDVAARGFTFVAVGDGGTVWKSTDSGGSWTATTVAGAPSLRAVAMPDDSVWYVAGSGGAMLKTTDAGGTWTALAPGTAATLNALRFTDALDGWVAGDSGTLLATHDGGASWSPAELQDPILPKAHTRFRLMWEWNGRATSVMSRATDETGSVQPTRAVFESTRGKGTDYHYNYIRAWNVDG